MLELNDVLLRGEQHTLSLMAHEHELTCVAGSTRWLYAMLGFEPVAAGFISIDGEPLTPHTAPLLRRQMAFAPCRLDTVGTLVRYEAPTSADVFALHANRSCRDDALDTETALTGCNTQQGRLLAVAALLQRPILLVESPQEAMLPYLRRMATAGRTVIVTSLDPAIIRAADNHL